MTDTTTNAGRCPDCAATAPYWRPDDRECEICLALAEVPDEISDVAIALDNLPGILGDDYGAVLRLRQIHGLLAEHVRELAADLETARQTVRAETVRAEVAAELYALIYHCPVHDIPGSARLDPACPGCQRHAALVGVAQLVAGHESPSVDAVRERRQIGAGRDLRAGVVGVDG